MTLGELDNSLPNGFHDAMIFSVELDYAAKTASSKGGEVDSDFDGSSDTQGDTPRFNAKIGTGVPKIQITTTYGAIHIRKSS